MNIKILTISAIAATILSSCKNNTPIGENTFIHDSKVYKVIDNQLTEIGDVNNVSKKIDVSHAILRDLGKSNLQFIKSDAYAKLKVVYRGNYLYYTLEIFNMNDLKDGKYINGSLSINLLDEYGFILSSVNITGSDLSEEVDGNNNTLLYNYDGKIEMSPEINAAIKKYSVASGIHYRK